MRQSYLFAGFASGAYVGELCVADQFTPRPAQLSAMTQEASRAISDTFQAKLLGYRLTHLQQVATADIDVFGLTPATQGLARALAACILGDKKLQSEAVLLLRDQDREITEDRSTGSESVVLEALLHFCHENDRSTVTVAALAEATNAILRVKGQRLVAVEVSEYFGTYGPSDDRRFSREVMETIARNKRLEGWAADHSTNRRMSFAASALPTCKRQVARKRPSTSVRPHTEACPNAIPGVELDTASVTAVICGDPGATCKSNVNNGLPEAVLSE